MALKLGRNDPCHCGSGKKYKRCCLNADATAASAALAAERELAEDEEDLFEQEELSDSEDFFDDEVLAEDVDRASPFEPADVLLVNYKRGLTHDHDRIGSGEGFQVTEWVAPQIPADILDVFEHEQVWELDGWWGDPDAAHPIQFDLITIQTLHSDVVIEIQNRAAVLAAADEDELATLTRVCSALRRAAERGTGRSWTSQEDGDDDAFEDGTRYDPDAGPDPVEWLALSEVERIERIRSWHGTRGVPLPNPRLHAATHTIIENQIALAIPEVVDALRRLRGEGLTRHDAVHAIGYALTQEIVSARQAPSEQLDLNVSYLERLKHLTAAEWRRVTEEDDELDG